MHWVNSATWIGVLGLALPRGAPAPSERRGKPCFIEIRRAQFLAQRGPTRTKARTISDGGEGGGCGELGAGGGEGSSSWFRGGGFELGQVGRGLTGPLKSGPGAVSIDQTTGGVEFAPKKSVGVY